MSREDQFDVRVTLNGVDTSGPWAKLAGGDLDSSETKFPPGSMTPEVSLGGSPTVDNLTVSRLFQHGRDDQLVATYGNLRGRVSAVVKKQPLDVDGNAFGRAITYTGTLKRIGPPDYDSESDDAGLIELEVTPNALVAA